MNDTVMVRTLTSNSSDVISYDFLFFPKLTKTATRYRSALVEEMEIKSLSEGKSTLKWVVEAFKELEEMLIEAHCITWGLV